MDVAEFINLIHVGKYGCGKPAVQVKRTSFIKHTYPKSADALHLDGRPIERHSLMVCDSCGKGFRATSVTTEENAALAIAAHLP